MHLYITVLIQTLDEKLVRPNAEISRRSKSIRDWMMLVSGTISRRVYKSEINLVKKARLTTIGGRVHSLLTNVNG